MGLLLVLILSYLFYRNIVAAFFLLPIIPVYLLIRKKDANEKKKFKLNMQFRDAIISVSASLSTGYSFENSIKEAYKEMQILHGKESLICKELENIIRQININIPVEKVFNEFAQRSELEDSLMFASILSIAKYSGGDMIAIIKTAATNISEKIDVKRDIRTIISSKKLEQTIMNLIPAFIILYIDFAAPGLTKHLYGNAIGIIVMSICLIVYISSYILSLKIVRIEV